MKFDANRYMPNPQPTDLKTLAKQYAARGLKVLPVRGKVPACPGGVHDATTNPHEIDTWPDKITGVAAAVPDGMVVVDVDPKNGGHKWLEANAHLLSETSVVHTGSGGWHLWYTTEPGLRYPAHIKGEGVDFRQFGNYVLMPGSAHESGNDYKWYTSGTNPSACPPWLEKFARDRAEHVASTGTASPLLKADGTLDPALGDKLAGLLAEGMIDGSKHAACRGFGGWANAKGMSWTDCEAILEEALALRTDVKNPRHGIAAARWCYENGVTAGWAELRDSLEDDSAAALDRAMPDVLDASDKLDAARAKRKASKEAVADAEAKLPDDIDALRAALGEWRDLSIEIPPEVYAVEGFPFQLGVVNGLVGFPGSGKSPLVATLIASWASDTEWFGRSVVPGRVLVACFEAQEQLARHIQRTMRPLGGITPEVEFLNGTPGDLHKPEFLAAIRKYVLARDIRHLIIDTYGSGAMGVELNESAFAEPAKHLEIPGVNTLVLLHFRKGQGAPNLESMAGTSALAGAIKGALGIQKPDVSSETFTVNWLRGGDYFHDRYFRFENISEGEDERWGLIAEPCDLPAPDKKGAKETQWTIRDRFSAAIRTELVPRMNRDALFRPTLAEAEAECGVGGSQERTLFKREITSAVSDGVLIYNKTDGTGRYFPA